MTIMGDALAANQPSGWATVPASGDLAHADNIGTVQDDGSFDFGAVREGLAVADDALDVIEHGADVLDGPDRPAPQSYQPVSNPPAPAPPTALAPAAQSWGLPGTLALHKDAGGWTLEILGRRIGLMTAAAITGALVAVKIFLFPSRGRGRRRRRIGR